MNDVPDDLLADSCCLAAIFAIPRVLFSLLIPGVWAAAHRSPTAGQSVQECHAPDGTGPAHTPGPAYLSEAEVARTARTGGPVGCSESLRFSLLPQRLPNASASASTQGGTP